MAIGFYGDVVWTPQGFRVVCSSHPETDLLLLYDERGELLSAQRFASAGALLYVRAAASPDGSIGWVAQSLYDRLVIGRISPSGEMSARHTDYVCTGQSGCAIAWKDGEFVIATLLSGTTYQLIWSDRVSEPLPTPVPTSQGWLDVHDTLHWIDLERDNPALGLRLASASGGVIIGQDISSRADRLVGVNAAGDRFLVYDGLGFEPRIASDPDRTKWVAVFRQENSRFGIVTLPPFPPVTEAAVVVPSFAKAEHRMAVLVDSEHGGPECADATWPVGPLTVGILHTNDRGDLVKHAQMAREHGLPLYAYQDDSGYYSPNDVPVLGGIAVIPTLQCYPLPGEQAGRYEARIERSLSDLTRAFGTVAVYEADYCQIRGDGTYALTEQEVLDSKAINWRLFLKYRVRVIWGFIHSRASGKDGVVAWAGIRESVARQRSAVKDWRDTPTVAELRPVPIPTPEPEPVKPVEPVPTPEPAPEPPQPAPEPGPTPEPVPPPVEPEPIPEPPKPKRKTDTKPALIGGLMVLGGLLAKWFGRKKKP
jgi:hypothetical protein